jgi:cytochrome c-type biogenesis protein CcmE
MYLLAIILIGVSIFLLFNAAEDMSTYATFSDAQRNENTVKIAGSLSKDKVMEYDPEKDPNYFSFFIRDTKGIEKKVILLAAKPQDFELSEQIVVTGKMKGEVFYASDLLMKCPSKYKDEEIYIKSEKRS